MKNYVILRIKKIKSQGCVSASAAHNSREARTLNADPKIKNVYFGARGKEEVLRRLDERLKLTGKVRKNAVLAVEYLVSGTPEKLKVMSRNEQIDFFKDSLAFLIEKHGKDNILNASVHFDETTPHMHCTVVPIDEKGKLNARGFFGGRDKMRSLQTDFALKVGSKFGFERGVEGSKSTHTSIKSFYSDIEKIQANKEVIELSKVDLMKELSGGKSEKISKLKEVSNLLKTASLKIETLKGKLNDKDLLASEIRDKNTGFERDLRQVRDELEQARLEVRDLDSHYHPSFVDALNDELREVKYNLKKAENKMLSHNTNKEINDDRHESSSDHYVQIKHSI